MSDTPLQRCIHDCGATLPWTAEHFPYASTKAEGRLGRVCRKCCGKQRSEARRDRIDGKPHERNGGVERKRAAKENPPDLHSLAGRGVGSSAEAGRARPAVSQQDTTAPAGWWFRGSAPAGTTTPLLTDQPISSCAPDDPDLDEPDPAIIDRARRLASDHEPLRPEDFDDVSIGNDGKIDKNAAKEQRQLYSRSMGQFAAGLRDSLGNPEAMPPELGRYVANLAEQERRFQNRRLSRSISLAAANEALQRRMFIQACKEHLSATVTPTGYAAKPAHSHAIRRAAVLHLSDLHLGADVVARDNPTPFGAVEEARRLEYILRSLLDFKPQYRDTTEAILLLNGDLIDGFLEHDKRDGIPLVEQKIVFWTHFRLFIGMVAQQFPSVRIYCQPGNHGRDTVRHPGRATSSKWDGHEFECYFALKAMCGDLPNVKWDITLKPVSIVDLFGKKLLLTHGDTEIKFKHPDGGAAHNAAELAKVNAERRYGVEFAACAIGHWHTPRYFHRTIKFLVNGALIPPNGWGRTEGYTGESCGQYLWEATEDYPIGDVRFLEVGPSQDRDEKLGTILKPYRLPMSLEAA